MKATIDKAGRVVIPKAIRDRAGLRPGMELTVRYEGGVVGLEPDEPRGRLVREHGVLVWEPPPGSPEFTIDDINEWIRQDREERNKF